MAERAALVRSRVLLSVVLALVALAGLAMPAAAQPAATFAGLGDRLSAGDRIKVEEASGRRQDARVLQVTPAGLTIDRGHDQVTLREQDVRAVWSVKRRIGRATGIGFLVGAATGALIGGVFAGAQQGDAGDALVVALIMGGAVAGVSAGVEAAVPSRVAVYYVPCPTARFTVRPVTGGGARGLAATVSF